MFTRDEGQNAERMLVVPYLVSPSDDNLQNYAPIAFEAMTNASAKFVARGMPVATF